MKKVLVLVTSVTAMAVAATGATRRHLPAALALRAVVRGGLPAWLVAFVALLALVGGRGSKAVRATR